MTASHRILSTFDIKATSGSLDARPDELMIDWTSLPAGSKASLYLPSANADAVISKAASMYGFQSFAKINAHTIDCDVYGVSYLPIPAGQGNIGGFIDVQLPANVKKGEKFTVTISQLSNQYAATKGNRTDSSIGPATFVAGNNDARLIKWRKVTGTFQLALKVDGKAETLHIIERNLSVLRWIFESIPLDSRWYPIFVKYLTALAGQVAALGGNPRIPPSATGTWPGEHGKNKGSGNQPNKEHDCNTAWDEEYALMGKIEGIIYDHFGDFEGFILETEDGSKIHFFSREQAMKNIVHLASAERLLVTVIPEVADERRLRHIILHPAR
jgi:hypothetical protein